jgi:hypothetical protein
MVERIRSSEAGRNPTIRHQERGGIELVRVERLRVRLPRLAPPTLEDRLADAVPLRGPLLRLGVLTELGGQLDCPV